MIRVEPYKHFYQDDVLFALELPREIKHKVNDNFVNDIAIGYAKWEGEEVKGKRKDTRKNEEKMRALIKMTEEKDAKKDTLCNIVIQQANLPKEPVEAVREVH